MTFSLPDSFFRGASHPMWVFDDESLKILDVNEAACLRYGYSRDEFLELNLLDLRSPAEQEVLRNRKEHPGRVWEHFTKTGEIIFIQGHEFPFELDGKEVVLEMIVDVTQRVHLEREKSEILQRYQVLAESANDLMWDWDLKTNQVTHNRALITQYGYSEADLKQPISWWSDKIHPEDYSIASWSIQEAISDRRKYWSAEYRFKKSDGSFVLVLDRGILHTDENDEPLRMVGSIVDLSTRRAGEDDRTQLFRLSNDSMLFMDVSGNITQANGAFYSLVGLSPEPKVERNIREFLSNFDLAVFEDAVDKILKDGTEGHFATGLTAEACKGKTIQWGLITNEARNRLFLVGRDITESITARQILEETVSQSQALAIEAQNARQAQSEFLQNMSHELRTPMNGLLGTAQLLAASVETEKQRSLANILVRSGESLLQILNDILDFSKIESGKITIEKQPFNLLEAVQNVYDLFFLSAQQKGLNFTISKPSQPEITVLGDSFRLRQVVSNLVGNAIKFTDTGTIELILEVSSVRAGVEALIKVRDTGIGVPDIMQDRIFERFVQVDASSTRRHGGTGLGLTISQTIIELMGGSISVSSALQRGSEFTVMAPFEVVSQIATEPKAQIQKSRCSTPGMRVLIAEDVEVNALILTTWLEERGFECVIVETGAEAIDALKANDFDGAFVDLHMPIASGYDVVSAVRSGEAGTKMQIPMVAVTASVSLEERQKCVENGFDDFIPKPIIVAELDRVVAKHF